MALAGCATAAPTPKGAAYRSGDSPELPIPHVSEAPTCDVGQGDGPIWLAPMAGTPGPGEVDAAAVRVSAESDAAARASMSQGAAQLTYLLLPRTEATSGGISETGCVVADHKAAMLLGEQVGARAVVWAAWVARPGGRDEAWVEVGVTVVHPEALSGFDEALAPRSFNLGPVPQRELAWLDQALAATLDATGSQPLRLQASQGLRESSDRVYGLGAGVVGQELLGVRLHDPSDTSSGAAGLSRAGRDCLDAGRARPCTLLKLETEGDWRRSRGELALAERAYADALVVAHDYTRWLGRAQARAKGPVWGCGHEPCAPLDPGWLAAVHQSLAQVIAAQCKGAPCRVAEQREALSAALAALEGGQGQQAWRASLFQQMAQLEGLTPAGARASQAAAALAAQAGDGGWAGQLYSEAARMWLANGQPGQALKVRAEAVVALTAALGLPLPEPPWQAQPALREALIALGEELAAQGRGPASLERVLREAAGAEVAGVDALLAMPAELWVQIYRPVGAGLRDEALAVAWLSALVHQGQHEGAAQLAAEAAAVIATRGDAPTVAVAWQHLAHAPGAMGGCPGGDVAPEVVGAVVVYWLHRGDVRRAEVALSQHAVGQAAAPRLAALAQARLDAGQPQAALALLQPTTQALSAGDGQIALAVVRLLELRAAAYSELGQREAARSDLRRALEGGGDLLAKQDAGRWAVALLDRFAQLCKADGLRGEASQALGQAVRLLTAPEDEAWRARLQAELAVGQR